MTLRSAAAACLLPLFAAVSAQAAPNRLDVLRQVVQNRAEEGLTRAQIRALARADKLLGKTPVNTMGEITAAVTVGRLLDKAFPGDAQFAFNLDNAVPLIQGDVTADGDALVTLLAVLPDDRRRYNAQSAVYAAEASVAAVAAAVDRRTKLALLRSAVASIGRGFNAVTRRQSFLTATCDDGSGPLRMVATKVRVRALDDPSGAGLAILIEGFETRSRVVALILYPVTGTGTFPLGSPPEEEFSTSAAVWLDNPVVFATANFDPGVATITRFDGRRAFDATFSFTSRNATGNTVIFADGLLRIR